MTRCKTWAVVGSSPNVKDHIERLRCRSDLYRIDKWITCNRGIHLIDRPDVFFVSDIVACHVFGQIAKRREIYTVTLQRSEDALRKRRILWAQEFAKEGDPYEPFQLSGQWIMEYAARRGEIVHLAGFEGYADGEHYFDKTKPNGTRELTDRIIEPLTNRIVAKYPDTLFICHGRPNYRVDLPNWKIEE